MIVIGAVVVVAMLIALLLTTWTTGPMAAKARLPALRSVLDAVIAMALVRQLLPWTSATSWLWAVAAAVVGLGAAGVVLRWREQPWLSAKTAVTRGVQLTATAVYAALGIALVVAVAV